MSMIYILNDYDRNIVIRFKFKRCKKIPNIATTTAHDHNLTPLLYFLLKKASLKSNKNTVACKNKNLR